MRFALALALAVFTSGCISMNTFETARTLEPGKMSHTMALNTYIPAEGNPNGIPMPKYSFAVGIADGFEGGVQAGLPGHIRLNAKYNPLRTKWFDAALSPAVWMLILPHDVEGDNNALLFGADMPLILDINFGDIASFIPWAGPGYVFSPDTEAHGAIVRAGVGVQFRLGRGVRIHPEFSTIIDPARGEAVDYTLGIAVSLGSQPRFL